MSESPLEREEQLAPAQSPDILPLEMDHATLEDIVAEQQLDPEIRALISRCMEGVEPYGRELKYWEPKKFSPINIATVLLLSAGFRQSDVAEILGIQQQRISVVACHPYGKKLIHALMHKQTGRVLDIRTRLETYAGDMLDKIYTDAMKSDDLKVTASITFDLLDRAGHNPTQKIESRSEHVESNVSDASINRLSTALEESARVNSQVMPYIRQSAPPAVGGESIGTPQSPSAGAEDGNVQSSPSSPLKRLAEAAD